MLILILGGTGFLSRHVAEAALARRHDVICAARGITGEPPEGAGFVRWDRDELPPPDLAETAVDVVIDISSRPRHVSDALDVFGGAHWVYVSSVSVYSDLSQAGGTAEDTPVHEPSYDDAAPDSAEAYGRLKAACEELVQVQAQSSTIVRPGIIAGPGDATGRFTYWPASVRAADSDGDPVLVPLPAEAPVQVIDARDLADWIISLALDRRAGVFDAVGPRLTRETFVRDIADGLGARVELAWVPTAHLETYGVQAWSGRGAVPLWIPPSQDDLAGLLARDGSAAEASGLTCRDVGETARDTLDWAEQHDGYVDGLDRVRQREILGELRS